ncbi:ABC transporter permease [Shinella sp. DD12]|uniref:ABC transporter permease n=1 Tax=Shinella sp. DD12 TaxID=1410620 RepID=UPI0003C55470|nr:ABC transporter permease [Shinella sp. DD12]EYR83775.1 ABC-type dipeptide/oligopeptide/nickel transport system permease component [Shinella sp. DD12]
MVRYLIKRAGAGLVLLAFVSLLTFIMVFRSPEAIAYNIIGSTATQEQIAAKIAALGLERPILTQYADWLGGAVQGDLGRSWNQSEPVSTLIARQLPVSLSMVSLAILVMAIVSCLLGLAAAVRGGWVDKIIQVLSVVGFSVPSFWLGLLLVIFFAVRVNWFPATGYVSFMGSPFGWATSLVLPVTALVLAGIASASQQVRGAIIDVLDQDYIRTLRARGVSSRSILFRHALRNAVPAVLTVLSLQFIALVGGAAVIEQVFAIPGLGSLTVTASLNGDVPVVMGVVVTLIILVVVVNLVIDLLNALANPKVRVQ